MGVQISGDTGNVLATKGTYTGNLTVGGVLTYEDVTNVDSVGLVTARSGIEIGARPGVAASISVDGNMVVSGITTIGELISSYGTIVRSVNDNGITIAGGTASNSGANVTVYGGSHGSYPDVVRFRIDGSEKARIDGSGRLLIGTTTEGNASGDDLTIQANDGGAAGITLRSDTDEGGRIFFSDGTSGADEYRGVVGYSHGTNHMYFSTDASERFRINSVGQVSVRGTTTAFDTTGDLDSLQLYYETDSGQASIGPYSSGGNTHLSFYTNSGGGAASEKLRIDSSGNVTVKTNDVALSGSGTLRINSGSTSGVLNLDGGSSNHGGEINLFGGSNGGRIIFRTGQGSGQQSEKMRLDENGRFGLGTSSPDTLLHLNASSGSTLQRFQSSSYSSYIAQIQSNDNVSNGSLAGQLHLRGQSGFSVSANNGTATHLTLDTAGAITNSTTRTQGQTFVTLKGSGAGSNFSFMVFGANSGGHNSASTAVALGKNSSNSRSINAGGTVNASGNDYAEYMTKSGDFTIAKGDICGIDANGKLTNIFSESISFVVKSTDPSYVGGDVWGTEEILGEKPDDDSDDLPAYEAKMEAARKMVDRIAFSGQTPVNVTGTTAGQHIIPTAGSGDTIIGVAKAEASLSMAEYMSSVGKVITLESDGRARIIVKVS